MFASDPTLPTGPDLFVDLNVLSDDRVGNDIGRVFAARAADRLQGVQFPRGSAGSTDDLIPLDVERGRIAWLAQTDGGHDLAFPRYVCQQRQSGRSVPVGESNEPLFGDLAERHDDVAVLDT